MFAEFSQQETTSGRPPRELRGAHGKELQQIVASFHLPAAGFWRTTIT